MGVGVSEGWCVGAGVAVFAGSIVGSAVGVGLGVGSVVDSGAKAAMVVTVPAAAPPKSRITIKATIGIASLPSLMPITIINFQT